VLGSISTAIYRHSIDLSTPDNLGDAAREAVSDSLWGPRAVRAELPAGLIENARAAFTTGFNSAAILSAIAVTILAVLAAVALRHIEKLGPPSERAGSLGRSRTAAKAIGSQPSVAERLRDRQLRQRRTAPRLTERMAPKRKNPRTNDGDLD